MPKALLRRELILAALLLIASVAVVVGAAMFAPAAGWVVAGVLFAALSIIVMGDAK